MNHLTSCRAYSNYQPPYEDCTCGADEIEKFTTLTGRIMAFVEHRPGTTAWGIAKQLGASSATVSSILHHKASLGIVRREKGLGGAWTYFQAGDAGNTARVAEKQEPEDGPGTANGKPG